MSGCFQGAVILYVDRVSRTALGSGTTNGDDAAAGGSRTTATANGLRKNRITALTQGLHTAAIDNGYCIAAATGAARAAQRYRASHTGGRAAATTDGLSKDSLGLALSGDDETFVFDQYDTAIAGRVSGATQRNKAACGTTCSTATANGLCENAMAEFALGLDRTSSLGFDLHGAAVATARCLRPEGKDPGTDPCAATTAADGLRENPDRSAPTGEDRAAGKIVDQGRCRRLRPRRSVKRRQAR